MKNVIANLGFILQTIGILILLMGIGRVKVFPPFAIWRKRKDKQ